MTVAGTAAAAVFVLVEAAGDTVCASREADSTQHNMREKPIFFIKRTFEMKPPIKMESSGYSSCASFVCPSGCHWHLNAENNFRPPFRRRN
jgi:hypothetical protein